MLLNRCKECGAPRVAKMFGRWNPDGTITAKFYNDMFRISFIEYEELRGLIDGISSRIGYSIDRIIARGERKANMSSVDELVSKGHGVVRMLARSFLGAPATIRVTSGLVQGLGHGHADVLEHKRGEYIRVRIWDPYSVPLVSGDLWGTYEAHFLMTAEATWEDEGDSAVVTIKKVQDGMVWENPSRLAFRKMPTFPGDVKFDYCPRCGVPREMTRTVEWDTERGIITNMLNGQREVMIIVEAINAVIGELTWELGDEIPAMVFDIEQAYVANQMQGTDLSNTTADYEKLLSGMCVLGQGNPVLVAKEGVLLTVRIDNPFCEPILAGRVAGYYQALEGVEPKSMWSPGTEGYTVIQVWPA